MINFILPDIGEGIVECEVVTWLVKEGDAIEEDQPVVEIMTDKAVVEIPAPQKGRITRLYYREGETAKVHEPLFAFEAEGEAEEQGRTPQEAGAQEASAAASVSSALPASHPSDREAAAAPVAPTPSDRDRARSPATPAVRRLVREHGLDLGDIQGSGRNGRVLKADVLAHLEGTSPAAPRETPSQPGPAVTPGSADTQDAKVRVEPIKGMRAAMARRMAHAASTIPHFIYGDEIDVTGLLALRERLKPQAEAQGVRLTLMPFIMKAMALAVAEHPILASRVNEQVSEIHYQPHCNIGMAVDGQAGLMVPNVKQVEHKSVLEIAAEVTRLTTAAREGRVPQADLQDGTITISNIGALGGTYAAPIINAPEVAIVALGKTQYLPRFDADGQVVKRAIMAASWAGDHRIIDGGTIARFGNLWKGFLESPDSMLLHLR